MNYYAQSYNRKKKSVDGGDPVRGLNYELVIQ